MGRIFQPLLFMLARCTRHELIRHIQFLKAENEVLRKRLDKRHVVLKPEEKKQLLELGMAIGPALEHLISIVCYPTFRRWVQQLRNQTPVKKRGRPATPEQTRELIIKIARETGWGYTRILGELHKRGIYSCSRQTVVNILKANGLEPGPRRGPGTWDEFVKIHAQTLWQCDFFSKRVLSRVGFPQVFAMVFLNVATRRVWISPSTRHPTPAWVEQQGRAFLEQTGKGPAPSVQIVTRDNDVIYGQAFDPVFAEQGVTVKKLAYRAPNTNAYVERFIQSLQVECLDHFLVFGEKHLDYLVREYVEHYHQERPHQGLWNLRIGERAPPDSGDQTLRVGEVQCRMRLGGLLKHYDREAA
jgi:putative transposase